MAIRIATADWQNDNYCWDENLPGLDTDQFTFGCRITPYSLVAGANFFRAALDNSGATVTMQVQSWEDDIVFSHWFDGDNGSWKLTAVVSVNTPYHYCVAYDRSATANDPNIYFNGSLQAESETGTPTGSANTGIDTLGVGGSEQGGVALNGEMSEAFWYNVILTPEEIAKLARGANPWSIRPANLVFYHPMRRYAAVLINEVDGAVGREIDAGVKATVAHPYVEEFPEVRGPVVKVAGGSVEEGAGASTGTSTAAAVGASVSAAVGASAGAASAAAVGASVAEAVGAGAGVGATAGAGASIHKATGSSTGISTSAAVGASIHEAAGASTATSTSAAVGAPSAAGVGASVGTSTSAAVGASILAGVGTSVGTSTSAAVGASSVAGAGASAGTSTAAAVGTSISAGSGVGVAAGVAIVAGVGASTATATGSAAGIATALAVGTSTTADLTASPGDDALSATLAASQTSVSLAGSRHYAVLPDSQTDEVS